MIYIMLINEDSMTLATFLQKSLVIPLESRNYNCNENDIKEMLNRWIDCYIEWKAIEEFIVITKDNLIVDGKKRLITLILILNKISEEKNAIMSLKFKSDTITEEKIEHKCDVLNVKSEIKKSKKLDVESNNIIKAYEIIKYLLDTKAYQREMIQKLNKQKAFYSLVDFKRYLLDNVKIHLEILDDYDVKDFRRENWKEWETFKSDLIHWALQNQNKDFIKSLNGDWLELFDFFREELNPVNIDLDYVQTRFIKFCLRMMYIAGNKREEGYEENSLKWLGTCHIKKLSSILNWMLGNKDNIISASIPMCLNYSFGNFEGGMLRERIAEVTGRYWKLDDSNYDGMLKQFLKNIYSNKTAEDDILVWCYISNVTSVFNIQEYLRTIKILLNNNRMENDKIFYNIKSAAFERVHPMWFERERIIWFTKYSVYGIPSYYNNIYIHGELKNVPNMSRSFWKKAGKENTEEKRKKFLFEIIMLNDKIMRLPENDSRIGTMRYIVEKNPEDYKQIKEIIVAEMEKQSNPDYLWHIRNLENLPYFNGLVSNVLNLMDNKNDPIRSNFRLTNDIKTRNKQEVEQSCAMIYKYLSKNDINLDNFVYKDNTIVTEENTDAMYAHGNVYTIPITLCDFFTDPAWRNYVRDYIINELPNSNDIIQCRYLYGYDLLPISWLTKWEDGFKITFFKDRLDSSNWNSYVDVAYKELSYLTSQYIFSKVTNEDVDINAYVTKCFKDTEFHNKFVTKYYYGY